MTISIHPALETKLRQRAEAEGLSIEAYVERLLLSEEEAEKELECRALEGLQSGEAIEVGRDYWEEKHRRLDERLKKTGSD
jgi:hypothetical protein